MTPSSPVSPPPEVAALWPPPAQVSWASRCSPAASSYFVVPSARRARLLVPTGVPGADRMLVRYAGGPATKAARTLWRGALTSRLRGRVPLRRLCVVEDPDGIENYLSAQLNDDIKLGVLLGPPRPNRKPVLQIFDSAGRTVAFAKVGTTPLAARLLDQEGDALELLAARPHATFRAPRILHRGAWRGMPVLVQEALPLAQAGLSPVEPPIAVMAEVAGLNGIRVEPLQRASLTARGCWFGIDLSKLERLHGLLDEQPTCPIGSWHGDFGPWNLATDGTVTQIWDWERFAAGVPVGLDAAHYRTQQTFGAGCDPGNAWPQIRGDVSRVLAACGERTDTATVVASAYLVAIFGRYVNDATDGPTPMLRRRVTWLSSVAALATRALQGEGR